MPVELADKTSSFFRVLDGGGDGVSIGGTGSEDRGHNDTAFETGVILLLD